MLYDTATGSLILLDDDTEIIAKNIESETKNIEIPPSTSRDEINSLISDGTILSDVLFPTPQKLRPKSLCLIISHACDMNCSYCSLAGVTGEGLLMTPETAKQALDWVVFVSPGRKIDIDFFGGEPLLAWDTIKKTVLHGEKLMSKNDKLIRWSLSTNCLGLDEEKILFCREHFISLILSLDGPKEINDKYRKLKNGAGSFEKLIPTIKKIASTWEQGFYVRGTYTRETINFSDSIISLHKMGIPNIAFEPVVTTNPNLIFRPEDLKIIMNEYEKLARYYIECKKTGIPIRFYHFELNLEGGVCARKSAGGCGAGCEYLSVSPDGSIWSCHQLDEISEHKIGNLSHPPNEDIFDKFSRTNHITNKLECPDCWASHLCAGGCVASNWLINGKFEDPYKIGCEIQKIRLEVALWVQSQIIS